MELAEHNRLYMKKNNLIRFIQSLVILPVMTMPVMFGSMSSTGIVGNVLAQKFNITTNGTIAINQAIDLIAIAIRESTGGKFECKKADFNAFGWGSCKINFSSHEEAVETVARNLGGNNPNTARHYDNKTTMQILRAYNPPYVVKRYAEQVLSIMNAIGKENLAEIETTNPNV